MGEDALAFAPSRKPTSATKGIIPHEGEDETIGVSVREKGKKIK
jgi:hypothetical protein